MKVPKELQALIEDGVPASALFAAAFGQEQPLVPNSNDKARAQNRRVEIAPVPRAASETKGSSKP